MRGSETKSSGEGSPRYDGRLQETECTPGYHAPGTLHRGQVAIVKISNHCVLMLGPVGTGQRRLEHLHPRRKIAATLRTLNHLIVMPW